MSKEPVEGLDEDVMAEKDRVLDGGASRDLIRIENLTKVRLSVLEYTGTIIMTLILLLENTYDVQASEFVC